MRVDELQEGTSVKFTILENYKDNRGSGKIVKNLDGGESVRGVCYVDLCAELELVCDTIVVDSFISEFGQMIYIWTGVDACIIYRNGKQYLMLVTNKYGLLYNRRNARRFKINALCTIIFNDSSSCVATIKDVSAIGIALEGFSHDVSAGDTIHVIFDDVEQLNSISGLQFDTHQLYKADVVRTDYTPDGLLVGCQFCNDYKTPIFTIT